MEKEIRLTKRRVNVLYVAFFFNPHFTLKSLTILKYSPYCILFAILL